MTSAPPPRVRVHDRIRFALERLLLRGVQYRLLFAAAIVAVISLVAGGLITLFVEDLDLAEAVWWAFLRLTDPGYLGDDEGLARRFVSTLVTVLGYIIFLGLLIAILTQWLNSSISTLESGITPVAMTDHVIILGWTLRTPVIVSNLLGTGARAQRFLARRGARELRIVILADRVDETLRRELRERLGALWNDRKVLLRSGTPLRIEHLERVAFRDAAALIVAGADFGERRPETADAEAVKTLMSISAAASGSDTTAPLAVAELYDGRRASVARRAYAGECEIVASDEIVSRIIAQSVGHRGLCAVFSELLTLNQGNALYVRAFEEEAGAHFSDLQARFDAAIPIGILRPGASRPLLNPGPEIVVEKHDELVFVARRFRDCTAKPAQTQNASIEAPAPLHSIVARRRRVLILGWSRVVPPLLREFEDHGSGAFEIELVSSTPIAERNETLARYALSEPNNRIRHIEAGTTAPGILESLALEHYDNIILLASERLEGEDQADAVTVLAYQIIQSLLPDAGGRPAILVELLDERNQSLFSIEEEDVIVSPNLVAYLLSQVALRRDLAAVFAELSQPGGAQFLLRPTREYWVNDQVGFEDLARVASERGEIALGVRRTEGSDVGITLNPDRTLRWIPAPDDELVVLATIPEPRPRA